MHIFFHVPKAAGTTFREMLRLEISAQNVLSLRSPGGLSFITDNSLNSMDLISGHVGVNLLDRISRPYVSLSLLRDPVARVLSQYRYVKALAEQGGYRFFNPRSFLDKTLESLLQEEDPFIESAFRNTQAWFFTTDWSFFSRDYSLTDADVLDRAKENIERLDFFGIVEELNLSYQAMNKKFHWSLLNDVCLNRSEKQELEVTPQLRELIQCNNHLDIELYSWAKKRFFEKCEQILEADRTAVRANNFSGMGWMHGIRTDGEKNIFYFLSSQNEQPIVKVGDSLVFNKTGIANATKVEAVHQNSKLSVFVTVDRMLDPEGDGFPNRILVHSGHAASTKSTSSK